MSQTRLPTFREALKVWLRIGCLSFGGPAGQIALLHREVVDTRNWVSDRRFLHALNFCTLLPGPEAQQLATYLGWLMHGPRGGLAAGLLFIIPGALVMLALSLIYAQFGAVPLIAALFFGLKCAVLVLVVEALLRVGRRALKGRLPWTLATAAFIALFFFGTPFPIVVAAAALIGYALPTHFTPAPHATAKPGPQAAIDALIDADPTHAPRQAKSARRAGLLALARRLTPLAAILPLANTYADIALFFSKMAVVTFGGAYAVLAYVAQDAVEHYNWLTAPEMLTGLGLAETTPGPLILVLQFVGLLAGHRAPETLTGIPGGLVGSAITLWMTFTPCFAFVFLGAPLIERLQSNKALAASLSAITAAIVGVIANLALWFAIQVLFRQTTPIRAAGLSFEAPIWTTLDPTALLLATLAALALFPLKRGIPQTLALCAAASLTLHLAFGVV